MTEIPEKIGEARFPLDDVATTTVLLEQKLNEIIRAVNALIDIVDELRT